VETLYPKLLTPDIVEEKPKEPEELEKEAKKILGENNEF
jgi:hypothetical protein